MDDTVDFQEIAATLALDETLAAAVPGETIRLPSRPEAEGWQAWESSGWASLAVGELLGEGGVGTVHSATQMPFGRAVAVKTLRGGAASPSRVRSLVLEAIAGGRLQHPNIIPIYSIDKDKNDQPRIVMKRVDGRSWRDVLVESDGAELVDDLQVLLEVCRAVSYAHELGIVHRDIKPENVMIGPHGDIYLVDWGLAVALDPGPEDPLPAARDAHELCGTPAYMAPEMTSAGAIPIDARTDVYLLGAVLHEVMTGTTRHDGGSMLEVIQAAFVSAPVDYPASIPRELAEIANKATARDPKDRFASTREFSDAIRTHLRHRAATALAAEAAVELEKLTAACERDVSEEDTVVSVYRHFGAARFGFEQALLGWPEQTEAKDGLQRALELMIEWEIARGSTHAAAALIAELPSPNDELAVRVDQLAHQLEGEREELERLRSHQRDRDLSVGGKRRALHTMTLTALVFGVPAALKILGVYDPGESIAAFWSAAFLSAGGAIVLISLAWKGVGRLRFVHSSVNRQVAVAALAVSAWTIAQRGLAVLSGVAASTQYMLELCAFTVLALLVGNFLGKRLSWAAVAYAAGTIASLVWPAQALWFYPAAHTVALSWMAWVFWTELSPSAGATSDR